MSNSNEQKSSGRLWGIMGLGAGIGACIVISLLVVIAYFLFQNQNVSLPQIGAATPAVVQEEAEAELPPPTDAPAQTAVPETAVLTETAVPTTTVATFTPPTPATTPSLVGSVTAFTTIYAEPNDNSSKLTTFATDTIVIILGRPPQGRWVLLQANGVTGYGSADYVRLPQGVSFDALPVQMRGGTAPVSTEAALSATTAVATQSATIFPAPNNSGTAGKPYIATDGEVEVHGRDASGSWLYVEDKSGNKGYVWGAYFTYNGQINQLPVITPVPPTATPTITATAPSITATVTVTSTAPPSTATIAYWQEMDGTKRDVGGGRWAVDLLVFVPSGGSYAFSVNGDLDVTAVRGTHASPHTGYDSYVVTISGMGCSGAFANDFYVKRDGQALEVRNEYTDATGAVYVESPGC